MDNLSGRLRIILSRKSPGEARKQQEGALRFYLQDELTKAKIIHRLKENLEGPYNKEGNPYSHKVSGYLEKSIYPSVDAPQAWKKVNGKNVIESKLIGSPYLGLGIGIQEFSVMINMASYAEKLNDGFNSASGLRYEDITSWVYLKARKNPQSEWFTSYRRRDGGYQTYYYSGNQVTYKIAEYIAKPIAKKLRTVGYKGSGWMEFLQGPAGLRGALNRAYSKYLRDYPEYVWATMTWRIEENLEKLGYE